MMMDAERKKQIVDQGTSDREPAHDRAGSAPLSAIAGDEPTDSEACDRSGNHPQLRFQDFLNSEGVFPIRFLNARVK